MVDEKNRQESDGHGITQDSNERLVEPPKPKAKGRKRKVTTPKISESVAKAKKSATESLTNSYKQLEKAREKYKAEQEKYKTKKEKLKDLDNALEGKVSTVPVQSGESKKKNGDFLQVLE
jgi:acetyl/propionyl-CoA carboxylase alpha subunit